MTYPLGSSAAEFERLRRQHETWRGPTEAVWRLAGFRSGQTIVDLGCGPGFTTLDLARLVGETGRVVGVDASATAASIARDETARLGLPNVRIEVANAGDVDLSSEQPDGVFARWLFCYLADPAAVLRRVAGSLRPGGVVAVIDYWHYLALRTEPQSPLFAKVFRAVYKSFSDAGGSLEVAGALPRYCVDAGLSVRHIEPVSAVGRPGSAVWAWISDFQTLYLPALVERGYLTRDAVDDYLTWWKDLEISAEAFVFAPPMLSIVGVKP
jgi:ubiquinone/menaquinone biosynthesis C-methylase UbiE